MFALKRGGALDPALDGDGMVFTDVTPKADAPFALAIQGDGRIVVAGGAAQGSRDPKFAVVRYERDGSVDTTFNGDGIVITNPTPYDDGAYSVAIGRTARSSPADSPATEDRPRASRSCATSPTEHGTRPLAATAS